MENNLELKNQEFTYLGKGSKITGDFHLKGMAYLAAELEGKIFMQANSTLTIERSGSFNGHIECEHIEIFGLFKGTLNARGKVIVHPSAKVDGRINARDLIIYPGADVNMDAQTNDH